MQDKFVIELRNRTALWVTESQSHIIDQAWQKKAIVKIGDSKINTVDITGIWSSEDWYENHPDDKPVVFHEIEKPLLPIREDEKSDNWDKWHEAQALDIKRREQGLPTPHWRVTREGELIEDPEYYNGIENTNKPALFEWVKLSVGNKRAQFYAESPGYTIVDNTDTGAVYAFKRIVGIEPTPHHLEKCTDYEIQKLERKEVRQ